jgi:hypothetical protein
MFPPETLGDYARRAESAGFDELWLWDDCFLPGALTSAAIALSATHRIKVGIGLLPATAYNPLFVAMEITTLARAFPGRILPGFGHGVGSWMTQIGAAPKSSLKTLAETVVAVRRLLGGELVTTQADDVNLDQVQLQMLPVSMPPLYVGAMRSKSLRLAGRVGDGTILTGMSSPAYVRWAREQIQAASSCGLSGCEGEQRWQCGAGGDAPIPRSAASLGRCANGYPGDYHGGSQHDPGTRTSWDGGAHARGMGGCLFRCRNAGTVDRWHRAPD